MLKRLLSLFLAAVLLIGLLPSVLPRVGAEPAPRTKSAEVEKEKTREEEALQIQKAERRRNADRELTEEEKSQHRDSPVISLNQEMTVVIPEGGAAVVRFTPTKTGWYQLRSMGDLDTYCEVYDEDDVYVAADDDSGDGMNFYVKLRMQAGRSYYFWINMYDEGEGLVTVLLEEYEPVTSGECGVDLTWRIDLDSGRLVIAGTGPMYDWGSYSVPWYEFSREIRSVSLPDGLTKIGQCAFYDCNLLESVELPPSLLTIGGYCFEECDNLTQITIPAKVKTIERSAFLFSGLLEYAVAEDNPAFSARDGVLFNKDGTTLIQYPGGRGGAYTIPAGVTEIGEGAFYGSWNLTAVTIPDGVTTIGEYAFFNCSSLREAVLPDSVAQIEYEAFEYCGSLESVRLPQGLRVLPNGCFSNCGSLQGIELPDQLQSIKAYAFYCCNSLQEITIPASVTEIDYEAFLGCGSLTRLTVLNRDCQIEEDYGTLGESTVTTVYGAAGSTAEAYAAEFGYEFVSIDLCDWGVHNYRLDSEKQHTDTAAGWKRWVCADCGASLRETIPAGHVYTCVEYTYLWHGTMQCVYCDASYEGDASAELSLDTKQTVTFTEDVDWAWLRFTPEKTGSYALTSFSNEDPFADLYDESGNWIAFDDDHGTGNNFRLSANLEAEKTYYFRVAINYEYAGSFDVLLTEFVQAYSGTCGSDLTWRFDPDTGVLTIEGSGWMDDFSWNSVPWDAFQGNITAVALPEGLKSIGVYAFSNCWNLERIVLPASVMYIGNFAFEDCESLSKITLPQSLKVLDEYAFAYCSSLSTVNMQKNLKRIGEGAFWDCPLLEEVTVPAGVEQIGPHALGYYYGYDEDTDNWTTIKVEDFTIRGFPGTVAEEYAIENEFLFIPLQEFADVTVNKWYYDAVLWAVGHDPVITTGTDETHFSPSATCTRAQVMTFIWHAEGDPEPASTANPFTDVKPNKWYTNAVLWAYHNDPQITSGATEDSFGLSNPCTRAQVVTFLWHAAGDPEPTSTENPFTDVKPNKWYTKAILWAVENGITSGMGEGIFGTNETCTRAQIVTFLYKADQIK